MNDIAVLTAATADYVDDFLFLWTSLRRLDRSLPIHLVNCGLGARARELRKQGDPNLHIWPHQRAEIPIGKYTEIKMWPTWIKPWLIEGCPAKRVLWLDSDIVVVRRLNDFLRRLVKEPIFVNEPGDPTWPASHYDLTEVADREKLDDPRYRLCAGAVGLDRRRDAHVLETWQQRILWTLADASRPVRYFDQGCLVWALHRLGLFECVLPGPEWHLPMVRQSVQLEELVSRAFAERQGLIATLAEAFPQARLLHFWARLKLSRKVLDSAHQLDRATLDT